MGNTFPVEKEGRKLETGQRKKRRTPLYTKLPEQISERNLPGISSHLKPGQGNPGQENTDPDKAGPLIETVLPVNTVQGTRVQLCSPPSLPTPRPPLPVTFYRKFRNFLSPPLSAKPFQQPDL